MQTVVAELDKTGPFKHFFTNPSAFVEEQQTGGWDWRGKLVLLTSLATERDEDLARAMEYGRQIKWGFQHSTDRNAGRLIKAWFRPLNDECGNQIALDVFVRVFNHIKTRTDILNLHDDKAGKRIKRIMNDMSPIQAYTFTRRVFNKCLEVTPAPPTPAAAEH